MERSFSARIEGVGKGKVVALLSGATALVLLTAVGIRLYQDGSLLRNVGPLSDPLIAAVFFLEAIPLAIGAILGLACAVIAWLSWSGRLRTTAPTLIVFGVTVLAGFVLAARATAPASTLGWVLIVLGSVTIVFGLRSDETSD